MRRKGVIRVLRAVMIAVFCWGCSSVKHVPDGQYLLDRVDIEVADSADIKSAELFNFLRQTPNHRVLGFARLQLATYSLSGLDSTKWYNRWIRRIGEPPVIYDPTSTEASRLQLRQALINRGYMDAWVAADTVSKGKRMHLRYTIHPGTPHTIASVDYNISDSAIASLLEGDPALQAIEPGQLFDRNRLDDLRGNITRRLRDAGYFAFNRDYITFTADTVRGSHDIGLSLNLALPQAIVTAQGDTINPAAHSHYRFGTVTFYLNDEAPALSEASYHSIRVVYGADRYLSPKILEEKCYITPGAPYSAAAIDRTYESLSQLGILKFINIDLRPIGTAGSDMLLDVAIYLSRNKKQSISVELEGTNSEGDLGFGVGVTYQHRNIARGSQLLTAKVRGAYESLSGNLEGLINDHYTEVAAEVGITFPKFECPFLSKSFKQGIRATTEFALSFNHQERPEYTRVTTGAAWRWKWQHRDGQYMRRHTYDLVDINYVRLPRSTIDFINQIAPDNPLLRYSYEDHFIMRMGYTFYTSNRRIPTATENAFAIQPSVSTFRASAETAGNLLYGISNLVHQHRSDGVYKVLGIQYSQYVKAEADYTYTHNFNSRNALAAHIGAGVAVPYGNSSMVPFEKRFYAGGANSVRGWSARTLGPGAFDARNSVTDFINQCGDIRLDLSVEYRAKLFWVLEGALFIDAGNIWTIRNYPNQPHGLLRARNFAKELAAAYGVGLRLDFTYFLLRFDLGLKAHNPAIGQEPWPIIHPKWGRDANFHFAVGYPF